MPRAELIGVDIFAHVVETEPAVDGEIVGDLPVVRNVDAGRASRLLDIVGNGEEGSSRPRSPTPGPARPATCC